MATDKSTFLARVASCPIVYRMSGLPAALRVMKEICSSFVKVDRVNAIYVPSDLSRIINVADSSNEYRSPVTPRKEGENPPLVNWENIRESVILGNVDVYRKEEWKMDPDYIDLPMMNYHSMARVPVCIAEDYVVLFNFWSENYNQFSLSDLDYFEEIAAPMETELNKLFSDGSFPLPSVSTPETGLQRLFLCTGMSHVRNMVEYVARTPTTVLITGETGTGKESVADAVHELSLRRHKPFLKINCGAIAETLLESELFGHERGAFTGAQMMRRGYFEASNGGTILLDEIGEMSLAAQTRLLRVLENGTVTRVGGNAAIDVDVRVIASTHADLEDMVEKGKFRKDLWYRLSVYSVHVPPLREHKQDIPALTHHFIQKKNKKMGLAIPIRVEPEEMKRLMDYDWPGNIRELEHVVERAMILWRREKNLHFEIPRPRGAQGSLSVGDWPTLDDLERRYVELLMDHCGGKLSGRGSVSAILGIHYTTLHAKLKKWGLA